MRILVGLGNPGRTYLGTRHNVGYEVVDAVAKRAGWIGSAGEFDRLSRSKFDGLAMDGTVGLHSGGSEKLLLLKPTTYMNLSGKSVQAAMAFYQVAPADVMVVVDDVALPAGKLRIRSGGSSGGHNGLRDIERALGTHQYPRLRIGIDAPPPRVPQKDWVLGKITEEQRQVMDPAIDRAAQAVLVWMDGGINAAMNRFNVAEEPEKKKTKDEPKRPAAGE